MRIRDFHRNIKIRLVVFLFFGTVQFTTLPFMAIYFDQHFGMVLTGILLSISTILSLVSGAIGGFYADRVGRKRLMVVSEAIFFLAYFAMAIANSPFLTSPLTTLIGFMITNICFGMYGPADEAMLLDVTPVDQRSMMYGLFYWLNNLTIAIGSSIGAIFFEADRFALFLIMSVVVLATMLITIFTIAETHHPERSSKQQSQHVLIDMMKHYVDVLKDRTFILYFLAGMFVMAVEFQLTNGIAIHLAKTVKAQPLLSFLPMHWMVDGISLVGFLQTENTIIVVLLATLAMRIQRILQEKWILLIGIAMNVIGYSVMTVSASPLLLFLVMAMATVGEVTSVPTRQAMLGDLTPEHARSSYVAVNGMGFGLARVIASIGVSLNAVLSDSMLAVLSLALGFIGLILYLRILPTVQARRIQNAKQA